jgi:PAS domain S-box-containing protein
VTTTTDTKFNQKSSIAGRLKVMTLTIAVFFLIEFLALFFTTQMFYRSLASLQEVNQLNARMRQTRDATTLLHDTFERMQKETSPNELAPIVSAAVEQTEKVLSQAIELARKNPKHADEIETVRGLFDSIKVIALKPIDTITPSEKLTVTQFAVEIIDTISRTQIAITADASRLFAEVERTRYRPITIGFILALVFLTAILFLGFRTSHKINESVQKLIDRTKLLAKGEFDLPKLNIEQDEIGYLAYAFEQMTSDLKQSTVSRNYVLSILESMLNSVIVLDRAGLIQRANQITFNEFGFPVESLIGKPLKTLFKTPLRIATSKDVEALCATADGKSFSATVSISELPNQHGQVVGYVCVIVDITERKRNEEELRRRSIALANANKELEAFSYSVSHDLRAPLRAIDGFSHAIVEDFGEKLDPEATRQLDRIRNASQSMGHLIDDMLKLSRLSRAEMKIERIDLSGLAREIAEELKESSPERKVDVKIENSLFVNADKALTQILLRNLIGNAWKYTSKKDNAAIEMGQKNEDGKKIFFIRDNGAGFNMEYATNLFGAFQRLHSTREFPGTGIGLATAMRIMRRHGGDVWAEAEVDKGATFFFYFP